MKFIDIKEIYFMQDFIHDQSITPYFIEGGYNVSKQHLDDFVSRKRSRSQAMPWEGMGSVFNQQSDIEPLSSESKKRKTQRQQEFVVRGLSVKCMPIAVNTDENMDYAIADDSTNDNEDDDTVTTEVISLLSPEFYSDATIVMEDSCTMLMKKLQELYAARPILTQVNNPVLSDKKELNDITPIPPLELPILKELELTGGKQKKYEICMDSKGTKQKAPIYSLKTDSKKPDIHDLFILACLNGEDQKVEVLLDLITHSSIVLDINISFSFRKLSSRNRITMTVLTYMLTKAWDEISKEDTLIHAAYFNIIKRILEHQPYSLDMKCLNGSRNTFLQQVVIHRNIPQLMRNQIIKLIMSYKNSLQKQLDIDHINKKGYTALYTAVSRLKPTMVEILFDHVSKPNLTISYKISHAKNLFTSANGLKQYEHGSILHRIIYLYVNSLKNIKRIDLKLVDLQRKFNKPKEDSLRRDAKNQLGTDRSKLKQIREIMAIILSNIHLHNITALMVENDNGENFVQYAKTLLLPETDEMFQHIMTKITSLSDDLEFLNFKSVDEIKRLPNMPATLTLWMPVEDS